MELYFEHKVNLSVASIYLTKIPQTYSCDASVVSVRESSLLVTLQPKCANETAKSIVIDVKDVYFLPDTCQQSVKSSEIHIRVHTQRTSNERSKFSKLPDDREIAEQGVNIIQCVCCGHELSRTNLHFRKLLPLPSDGWQEMACNWFCHKYKNGDIPSSNKLLPKEDVCLTGGFYLLVHPSVISDESIKFADNAVIACKRCKKHVGLAIHNPLPREHHTVSSTTNDVNDIIALQFYLHKICWEKESISKYKFSQEVQLTQMLLSTCHKMDAYKCLVQASLSGKTETQLLVWIMGTDVQVASSHAKEEKLSISSFPVIKILYLDPAEDAVSKVVCRSWERDLTVHNITLLESDCLLLHSLLQESTLILPPSLQSLNNFKVGHLRIIDVDHSDEMPALASMKIR